VISLGASVSANETVALPLLVVTLSNIGDMVMTTPVLETLTARYPDSPIDIVGDARSSDLLRAAPYVRTILHRDKRGGLAAQWRLLRALRTERYALAVDLRTPVIPFLVRAARRLIKRGAGGQMQHAVDEHHAVLTPLVGSTPAPYCRLYLESAAMTAAADLLAGLPGRDWLAIAPGANWAGKRWPADAYRELVDTLAGDFDAVIVLGGPEDRTAASVLHGAHSALLDFCGRTTLPVTAALLARARAFVGNDSGLGHMAAALGIATLTVFGPGQPERYRPWGPRTHVTFAPENDLSRLSAATVAADLRKMLEDT